MKKLITCALIGLLCGYAKHPSLINQNLLEAHRLNVLEQPIIYPTQQPAEVTSVISVLQPGEETGWHKHMVPLHAYVMEGTSTMEFETNGGTQTRTFSNGSDIDSFMIPFDNFPKLREEDRKMLESGQVYVRTIEELTLTLSDGSKFSDEVSFSMYLY